MFALIKDLSALVVLIMYNKQLWASVWKLISILNTRQVLIWKEQRYSYNERPAFKKQKAWTGS